MSECECSVSVSVSAPCVVCFIFVCVSVLCESLSVFGMQCSVLWEVWRVSEM